MRLLYLEIKRVVKTRLTWILLLVALFFSVLMAYIPTTFPYTEYVNEKGERIKLEGMDALRHIKSIRSEFEGEVTPELIRTALEEYQSCLTEYGVQDPYELPEGVYYDRLTKYAPFIHGVKEAFADPKTGMAPSLLEIDSEQVEKYYEKCADRLGNLMQMEQKDHSSAQTQALEMYQKIPVPFQYYFGVGSENLEYQTLLIFLMTILLVMITAPIFSSDSQTCADDILRCTKHGRVRLAATKIVSGLLIGSVCFLVCGLIWILVTNSLFGWESTKTSMQMLFTISSLPAYTVGRLQWVNLFGSFLMVLALLSLTLFFSSKTKSTVSSMVCAMIFVMLPFMSYFAMPNAALQTWAQSILPGGGIGLQNSLLYAMIDLNFLHMGGWSAWNVTVMLIAAAVEIPLFLMMTVYTYCKRKS